MIELQKRICFAILLAGFLAFPKVFSPAVSTSRRAKANAAFDRAVRMRTTLESLPESKRTKADYTNVIKTFRDVARFDPAYAETPVALGSVAELYQEMGRVFSSERYYLEAAKTCLFLSSDYPHSRVSRDALFRLGEIYRTDLGNLEEARKTFQQFLDKYPKASQAEEAKARINEIDQLAAQRTPKESLPPFQPAEDRRSSGLPEVTAVRRWVGPNYSRVVIAVDGEVKFETSRLSNPDRIVLDIENARLSPALVTKSFPVEDGFLHQVRVGQFTATVARVVLDVGRIEDYSVLPLPNPFRLVVDIHGATVKGPEKERAERESVLRSVTAPEQGPGERSTPTGQSSKGSEVAQKPAVATLPRTAQPVAQATGKAEASETKEVETASVSKIETPPLSRQTQTRALEPSPLKEAPVSPKAAAPTQSGSRTLTRALGLKIGRIVIDPGHGGHDTGTIGPTGLEEKEVVLDVGLRLKKLLERKAGCDVVMTRADDTFIPLEERTAAANEKAADLFVSIHANASRDRGARGIETYYLNFTSSPDALEVAARENATSQESVHELQDLIKKIAMTEKIKESEEFARQVQREVYLRTSQMSGKQRDRGVKKAPFVVLIGANMPSVLAEISFLTNPGDEKSLRRADYRQRIAEALYQGILDYVNNLGGVKVAQGTASENTPSKTGAEF